MASSGKATNRNGAKSSTNTNGSNATNKNGSKATKSSASFRSNGKPFTLYSHVNLLPIQKH